MRNALSQPNCVISTTPDAVQILLLKSKPLLLASRKYRLPRIWSNSELRSVAPLFTGDVVNVSGWRDEDKEGGHYRDYFCNANGYAISNHRGARGWSEIQNFVIDLEEPLAPDLHENFDVVFNHTTLEHVFNVFKAMENLCAMSRDVVILVVPFVQEVHVTDDFLDYWRFTHHGLRRVLEHNGMTVIRLTSTPYARSSIYHFCVASRHPDRWEGLIDDEPEKVSGGDGVVAESVLFRLCSRFKRR